MSARAMPFLSAVLVAFLAVGSARAEAIGDPEAGKIVFDTCKGCHKEYREKKD